LRPLMSLALALALLDPIASLDARLQAAVEAGRSPAMDRVMQAATDLGRKEVVLGLLLGVAILDPAAGPATARYAVAALVGTNLAVEGLKRVTDRPRPDGERRRSNSSFPSSHAANAACLAWVLGRRWRRAIPVLALVAAAVSWSRVYLNRHYPSDVLAGVGLGLGIAWAVSRAPWFRASGAPARVGAGPEPPAGGAAG